MKPSSPQRIDGPEASQKRRRFPGTPAGAPSPAHTPSVSRRQANLVDSHAPVGFSGQGDTGQDEKRSADWLENELPTENGRFTESDPDWLDAQALTWEAAHRLDLVERLRKWAGQLDAREARLNARIAMQEQRERQFRLLEMDAREKLAEQTRKIDQIRRAVQTQARRLAFESR